MKVFQYVQSHFKILEKKQKYYDPTIAQYMVTGVMNGVSILRLRICEKIQQYQEVSKFDGNRRWFPACIPKMKHYQRHSNLAQK